MLGLQTVIDLAFAQGCPGRKGGPQPPQRKGLHRAACRPGPQAAQGVKLVQGPLDLAGICGWGLAVAVQPPLGGAGRPQVLQVLKARSAGKHVHQRKM